MEPLSRTMAVVYLAVTFLLGGVTGWSVGYKSGRSQAFRPPPSSGTMSQRILERLTQDLELTPEQQRQIEPLIQSGAAEMEKLHRETTLKIREAIKRGHEKLFPLLTEKQKTKLAELDAAREKNGWGRWGGPRPPETNREPTRQPPPRP